MNVGQAVRRQGSGTRVVVVEMEKDGFAIWFGGRINRT